MDSRAALRITSIYVALAGVWILASDSIVARVFPDAASRYQFSVLKGLAFVTLTGAVLFLLVRAQVQKLEGQRNRAEASNAELRQRDAELRQSLAERQRLYDELEARTRHSASLEAQLRQAQKMEWSCCPRSSHPSTRRTRWWTRSRTPRVAALHSPASC
jgi:cell shape-determining protein MreC